MWPIDHNCDILVKNVAMLCSCPKTLHEAKLKSFGLKKLAERFQDCLVLAVLLLLL